LTCNGKLDCFSFEYSRWQLVICKVPQKVIFEPDAMLVTRVIFIYHNSLQSHHQNYDKNDRKAFGRSSKHSDSNFVNLNTFLNPMTQSCDIKGMHQIKDHTQICGRDAILLLLRCVDFFVTIFFKNLFVTLILGRRKYILLGGSRLDISPLILMSLFRRSE
jgi:hypothetical protein